MKEFPRNPTQREKVILEDIIGLIKTDETTNSVELKKDLYRYPENKRFTYEYDEYNGNLFDNKMNTFYHIEDSDENIEVLCDRLNWLVEENEQLKSELKALNKKYIAFSEATDKRLKELYGGDVE